MSHFNIDLHCSYLDSLIKNELMLTDSVKGYSAGDCAGETRIFESEHSYMQLHFFKHEGGEYGFGNEQYFFIADSLNLVRTFEYYVIGFPTDSTNTVWLQEEKIYELSDRKVRIHERRLMCEQGAYLDISQIPFKDSTTGPENIYPKLMEYYRALLHLQDQKE